MMPKRTFSSFVRLGSALALVLVIAGCTKGGQFDPTEMFNSDAFDSKKKISGQREPVFPQGVPGTTTGVPPDLVKGYQAPPEQAAEAPPPPAPVKPKPSPKPKTKVARAPPRMRIDLSARPKAPSQQPAESSQPAWPSAPPQQPAQSAQSAWPTPSAPPQQTAQPAQSVWPTPSASAPPPQRTAQPAQSVWPDPPAAGSTSR
jgi:hypothetical protein